MEIDKETTTEIKRNKSKILKIVTLLLWIGAIAGVIGAFLLFNYISKQDIPSFADLENPEYDQASIIYDDNGITFGKYYVENRVPVQYEEISPYIVDALVSTEDERFYNHSGIDVQALTRVAFKTVLLRQESSGGGSTITQQLAKLLFKRPNLRGMGKMKRTFELIKVKLKEWMTAVKLERSYTKEEIMAMYLNKFEFINGAHGIQAASQTYFSKEQENLNIDEAAILVGMLKNPSLYNPLRFPEKSKARRNIVLGQMEKADKLDREAYDTLTVKDVNMDEFQRKTQSEGPAPYFRSELTKWLRKLFKEKDITKTDGTNYNIYTDGLKIYTTLDLRYQKHAEDAVVEHMKWNQDRFNKTWKNKDPWEYEADDFQKKIRKDIFERRVRASERYTNLRSRLLGETIAKLREKYTETPFTDNAIKAMIRVEEGKNNFEKEIDISPCTTFDDIQYTIAPGDANFDLQDEWTPANANGEFTLNKYNLYHGLLYSKNSITVRLVKEMGTVQVVRELLKNVGINVDEEVANNEIKVPNLPSISLGAVNLSLREMTGAYTAFANNGMYTEPIFIKRIEDKYGKVIYNAVPEKKVAINPKYNAVMVDMLQNNVGGKYGLGIETPVGGKTGTTNDYTDGWFMSITPNLVSGTWVGGDDRWIRFLTLDDGQGYVLARPIVQKYLKKLEADEDIDFNTEARFSTPPEGFSEFVDCSKYKEIAPEEEQAEILQNKKALDEFEEEFGDDFEDEFEDDFDEDFEDMPIDTTSIPVDTTGGN